MSSRNRAYYTLIDHRHYRYRGCAPDPDQPDRAQGDVSVSVNAWLPFTEDEQETPTARNARQAAAQRVCGACPVLAQCRAYALSETDDGRLSEPEGVWGGMLPLARHRDLVARRTVKTPAEAAAGIDARRLAECRTDQKQAVLRSLAAHIDEELVAYGAGMDVRTANWHRSLLCGLLGLDKERATRQQLLDAARAHDVLPTAVRVAPDGPVPIAAAPNTDGSRQRRLARGHRLMPARPIQLILPGYEHLLRVPRPRRTRPAHAAGRQLRVVRVVVEALTLDALLPATPAILEPVA
ncbi:WhiB family transcriptional regulator [Streptomyces sp. NPDC048611]|uniref:WhiB family transcriptional regulator n=1 Tax=Streptomyces sp. NPDC048611 TaxID=3155635 RepID=UPI003446D21E